MGSFLKNFALPAGVLLLIALGSVHADTDCWIPIIQNQVVKSDGPAENFAPSNNCQCQQVTCPNIRGEKSERTQFLKENLCIESMKVNKQCSTIESRLLQEVDEATNDASTQELITALLGASLEEILLNPAKYETAIRLLISQIVSNPQENTTINQFLIGLGALSNVIIQEVMKDPALISSLLESF